jgi:hypothetical protein
MKQLILITALVLATGLCFGQSLKKGNFLGFHIMTIELKPNVTIDDFTSFYINKLIPEVEKQWKAKGYLVKGIRGENKNTIGVVWVFESEEARNKYFAKDDTFSELGKAVSDRVKATENELEKLGTYTTRYTDWVIQ